MEKDTVVLKLQDYLELRDFKKNIENGKFLVVSLGQWNERFYYTESQIVEELSNQINGLNEEIKFLRINRKEAPMK